MGQSPVALNEAVTELVATVRSLGADVRSGSVPVPDRPPIVTLIGGRGTGKSTTLAFAMRELASAGPGVLVLPAIDPERFSPGESLGGWTLALLEQTLEPAELSRHVDESTTVLGLIQQLQRWHAVRSSAFLPGLEQRGLSFEDFGRDAAKVPLHGVRFPAHWQRCLDEIAVGRGSPTMQLVIPVDDADVVPELLPEIVSDSQLLATSSRVCLIFAADETTLRHGLEFAYLSRNTPTIRAAMSSGLLSTHEIRSMVSRQLTKHFPRSLRVTLSELTVDQRLHFRPLLASRTIYEILLSMATPAMELTKNIGSLFTIRDTNDVLLAPSGYARCLPSTARDLRQLHETLERIDAKSSDAGSDALAAVLQFGLRSLEELDILPKGRPFSLQKNSTGWALRFDSNGLVFGRTTGNGVAVARQGTERISGKLEDLPLTAFLQSTIGSYAQQRREDEGGGNEGGDSPVSGEHLPEAFAYLSFLAWEAVQQDSNGSSILANAGTVRTLATPGSAKWQNGITAIPRVRYSYWTVPDWEGYLDYFIYDYAWAKLMSVLDEVNNVSGRPVAGDFSRIEFALVFHIRLVAQTQSQRRLTQGLINLDQRTVADIFLKWDLVRSDYLDLAATELRDAFGSALAREGVHQRSADFSDWVREDLLPHASLLFTTPLLADWVFSLWQELTHKVDREATDRLAGLAGEHLQTQLGEADLKLLELVDRRRATQLAEARAQLSELSEDARLSVLNDLRSRGVSEDVLAELQSSGLTDSVAISLLSTKIPSTAFGRIAETFRRPEGLETNIVPAGKTL